MPFYDTDELLKRITHIIADPKLVERMVAIKDGYEFTMGLYVGASVDSFFANRDVYQSFVDRNNLCCSVDSRIFDESELVKILMNELKITEEQADAFLECERSYCVEIGIM
jgi:hypothetical protein